MTRFPWTALTMVLGCLSFSLDGPLVMARESRPAQPDIGPGLEGDRALEASSGGWGGRGLEASSGGWGGRGLEDDNGAGGDRALEASRWAEGGRGLEDDSRAGGESALEDDRGGQGDRGTGADRDGAASSHGTDGLSSLPDDRFVFQRLAGGRRNQVGLSYEIGYGTRDTRFFGAKGLEQGVRARWNLASFLTLDGQVGLLMSPDSLARPGASAMLLGRVLRQERFGLDLHLGGGYRLDYRGDHVLRFLLGTARRFGRVWTAASAVIEVPLTGKRDEADVMFAASAMVPVTRWFAQGFELGAEDIEGLWDPDEAEGGARFLAGPSSLFHILGFELRVNLSFVYAYVANQTLSRSPPLGLAARASVGYRF